MTCLLLFWEFFKTGLFSVGGGLATLPFLYDMGERTGWFTAQQVADMLAISESTPGPIGVNMAVYTGFVTAGFWGSVCALIGLITPSILVILIIAAFLKTFRSNRYVQGAFYGLRPASTGLIAAAGLSVAIGVCLIPGAWIGWGRFRTALNWKAILLAAAAVFIGQRFKKLHPAVLILGCALLGIVLRLGGA